MEDFWPPPSNNVNLADFGVIGGLRTKNRYSNGADFHIQDEHMDALYYSRILEKQTSGFLNFFLPPPFPK